MMIFWLLAVGLVALVAGAELLVRGASQIALRLGISSLLVGLTVVAFGTSAPELAVSVTSGINGQPDIALGNVVGSNILNVLLILGLSALLAPLVVHRGLVTAELPIMIVVSFLVIVMSADGQIGRLEGGLLSFGLLVFVGWQIVQARRQARTSESERELLPESDRDGKSPGFGTGRVRFLSVQIGLIAGGLVLMVLGAGWMVDGATRLTLALGVSELVISLTVVACGTSLPELATSATAALRGERDIAVGNVVGSNIFNILGVLGVSAAVSPQGIKVAEQALWFDIPVMIAAAVLCWPILFSGYLISRREGAFFLACYAAYVSVLVFLAVNREPGFAAELVIGSE